MSARSPRQFSLLAAGAFVVLLSFASSAPVAAGVATQHPGAERLARKLLNCTRTGGWVQKDGTCIDRGTGKHSVYRAPLPMSSRTADDVARPMARRVAEAGYLDHNLGGSIQARFKAAGITCTACGESLGHYVNSFKKTVIQISRWVQDEKSSNGWHWRNVKDTRWKNVGIGVWSIGNDIYVAFDFWDGKGG
jgi:hypothetical protein